MQITSQVRKVGLAPQRGCPAGDPPLLPLICEVDQLFVKRSIPADTQRIGSSVYVVEPGGNQSDLEDALVIKANRAQTLMVRW
jgi:hypothetical protein